MTPSIFSLDHHDAFRVLRLRGSAYERGRQHGLALKESVRFFRDAFYRDLLYARSRMLGVSLNGIFITLAARMERFIPRELREEMLGVADGAGISYRDVLIINSFDDAIHGLSKLAPLMQWFQRARGYFACSSFVRLGDSGPIHGRNLDYMVADSAVDPNGVVTRILRENVIVFVHEPDQGYQFTSVAWPGYVGIVTGMNAAGLSLACHTSWTPGETVHGIPLPLLYRHVVQYSPSLANAEQRLRRARRTIGNNISLASSRDHTARAIELAPRQVASRAPHAGTLAVTNHFQDPTLSAPQARAGWLFPNSVNRLDRLHALLPATASTMTDAEAVLSDAEATSPDLGDWDCLVNPGTIYSTVFDPTRLRLSVRIFDQPDRPFSQVDLTEHGMPRPLEASESA
ncbi:MAG: C45 family autoproteolytic acyltransferase/hydrolase [Chloroflexota bacterium]